MRAWLRQAPSGFMRVLVVDQDSALLTAITQLLGDYFTIDAVTTKADCVDLVRDITDVLAYERLSIEAMTTTTDRGSGTAHVLVTVAVDDLEQLTRVLKRLTGVPSVIHARRLR